MTATPVADHDARALRAQLVRRTPPAWAFDDLAWQLGISRRRVEKAVEKLRAEGQPICTGPDGAWYSWRAAEVAACADRLEDRLRQQMATIRALRATAAKMQAEEDTAAGLALWPAR